MAAFTDYKALDFSGLDKSINSIAQRQQLSKLGQGIDGTPEGFAKAGQSLLALGDIGGATNMFALSEKARERSLTDQAYKSSPFNAGGGGMGTPRSPVAPALSSLGQSRPGESGYKPVPTIATSEAEVQALEGSTGTPGQKVAARLVNNGLTPTAAAGIAGNLNTESRFRTDARNPGDGRDGSDSIGLAQWNGPRAQALQQFAAQQGKDWRDPNVQSDFIAYELRTTEGRSGAAIANAQTPQQAGAAAIGYFRPQGYTSGNPMGALKANERVAGANQFVLGGEPAPASGAFVPQTQVAQAPAEPGAPVGSGGVYAGVDEATLNGYLNNPNVAPNLKALMQQELARRQSAPAAPQQPQQPAAPVQVAQAPVEPQQPGSPVADMPAQGATPVTEQPGGFRLPGTPTLPPNDPFPNVATEALIPLVRNAKHPDHALAVQVYNQRQAYSAETAPEKREQARLETQKKGLEIQKLEREVSGVLTPEQEAQKIRLAKAGRTVNEATLPPGYRAVRDPEGNLERIEPIPGSKAEAEVKQIAEKKAKADVLKAETGNIVANALDDIDRLAGSATLPVAGALGARVANIPGTAAHDVAKALETVGANISFGQLQQMRESSPTGGALGGITEGELQLLKNSYANLSQSQSPDQFKTNLGRVRATFERVVHGRTLTNQERKTGGPMTMERAKGLREQAQQAIASGAPREGVLKRLKEDYGITPEGL